MNDKKILIDWIVKWNREHIDNYTEAEETALRNHLEEFSVEDLKEHKQWVIKNSEAWKLRLGLIKRAKEKGMKYIAIEYCDNPAELLNKSNSFEWHYQTFNDEKTKKYFEEKGMEVIELQKEESN